MESQQMVHPHGHSHDQQDPYKTHDPNLAAEGEDHPEKMSMMKKVKAKARMIRDTITKHGHGHDQHQVDHAPDDHDLDEEDGEDDDIVEDPEVHGAPITVYESTAVISSATPVNTPHESSLSRGKSETKESDPSKTFETKESDLSKTFENKESDLSKTFETKDSDPSKTFETKDSDPSKIFEIKESDPSNDPSKIFETKESGPSKTLETKESDPSKTFETKESDPSKIFETEESDPSKTFETEESDPSKTFETEESDPGKTFETKESDPSKTFVPGAQSKINLERPKGLEEESHAPKDTPYGNTPSNYQTKVTDPTGAGNEEIGDTPVIRSFGKMNIDDESKPKSQQNRTDIGYSSTGSHDQFSQETPDKPSITPQHPPQTCQENKDTVKSGTPSLTKKISSATYSIADKAMSAKNVVASKLGYGEKDARGEAHDQSSTTGDGSGNKQSSLAEYGKKIASTVTEKSTPVDEKVAEAGTPVVSKKQGATTTTGGSENVSAERTGQDRGVSVRDYLAEKLRPGEDDRALSEVISDALHKRKEEPGTRPMGKVTESEEVARRLGTGDNKTDEREQSGSVNQAGEKSVVDKVKGTVGSWLGYGGDQSGTAKQHSSHTQGEVGDDVQGEERRVQQSSN